MPSAVMQSRRTAKGHPRRGRGKGLPVAAMTALLAVALGYGANLVADEVRLPIAENVRQGDSQSLPSKGNSIETVAADFGEPDRRTTAVGQPPISQWHYPGFVVYFENSHVIHAVLRR